MPPRDPKEKMRAGQADGGILVGRTLVNATVKDPVRIAEIAELARYSQMLAGKLRLPFTEIPRITLAAWLSALDDRRELIDPLVQEFELQAIFAPPGQEPVTDDSNTGWLILSLVAGYQELKKVEPGVEKDIEAVRAGLREAWANSAVRQSILNKFMLILRDEAFLHTLEAPSAKVLIVDPAEVISSELSLPLRNQGYEVSAAGNVPAALKTLGEFQPDLILSEVSMPLEDGLALCAIVKEKPETKSVPIIMMTSSKSQRTVRECMKAGAEDVVIKPIDMELFFIKLRKLFESRKPVAAAGAGVTGSLQEISLTDLVQMLNAGMRSTKVVLNQNGQEGIVYFQNGNLIDATVNDLQGETAFYKLMKWKTGTFATQVCDQFPPRTIQAPLMSVLMEGARQNDEGSEPEGSP